MGFFDFWEDVKDNHEKSKEARECIQRAKELVKEGERIYEAAYDKVQSYACVTILYFLFIISRYNLWVEITD